MKLEDIIKARIREELFDNPVLKLIEKPKKEINEISQEKSKVI